MELFAKRLRSFNDEFMHVWTV